MSVLQKIECHVPTLLHFGHPGDVPVATESSEGPVTRHLVPEKLTIFQHPTLRQEDVKEVLHDLGAISIVMRMLDCQLPLLILLFISYFQQPCGDVSDGRSNYFQLLSRHPLQRSAEAEVASRAPPILPRRFPFELVD